MLKNKVGIVTHYYKSKNYGGNLQAYALCKAIAKYLGNTAEQICYPWGRDSKNINYSGNESLLNFSKLKVLPGRVLNKFYKILYRKEIPKIATKKEKSFFNFSNNIIPHSEKVYYSDNIHETLSQYDAFITGSDQVWNMSWYTPVFFLDFVPSDKIKISYAASISKDSLTGEDQTIFKKSLADYKAVSVREEQAVNLIKDLSPVPPCVTLDPTLLLDESDWDEVCAPRVVEGDYLFCYFLGNNPKERQIAKKFAKDKRLKLVSVPLTGAHVYSDLKFGDVILPATSPEEFISLIKYAKYIFTDSFHAVVFSHIYKRQYFVFNRDSKGSMNSRIINITGLFNTQNRFCNGKERETLEYVQSLKCIDYSKKNEKFEELKRFSIDFLKNNLEPNQ